MLKLIGNQVLKHLHRGSSNEDGISDRYVSVQAFLARHGVDAKAIQVSFVESYVDHESSVNEVLDYVSMQAFLARHGVDEEAIQVSCVEPYA